MTIPASAIVNVNPGVISGGGNPLALNGVFMTKNTLVPTSSIRTFTSADAVSAFFGPSSQEYSAAQVYFLGYDNSYVKPGQIIFAPYVDADRAAYNQSGSFAGVTLAQLQALAAGVLTVTVDGAPFTSSSINLSGATSFTNAATIITAAFTGTGKPTCTWNSINSTFVLTSPTTGAASTITYATGTMSATLKFTSATGAVLSQGDIADTPATAMDNVWANTQNWVAFTTMWEPLIADKTAFAVWTNAKNQRILYVQWDTDAQAIVQNSTSCFAYVAKQAEYNAVMSVYNTLSVAAETLGAIASIDFTRTNGRITLAFKSQSGIAATVTDQTIAYTLLANGYNFVGQYGTANDQFTFMYSGQISGKWLWADTYIDQIYLNSQFQLYLMTLLTNTPAIPYNQSGYNLIRATLQTPIAAAINSGIIRVGVSLSSQQKAIVNQAAGVDVGTIIEQQGYYLQVLDPGSQVRQSRGTPVINFWYTDGGAIQKISMTSVDIL